MFDNMDEKLKKVCIILMESYTMDEKLKKIIQNS
jgi:hypothetical protein